MTAKKGGSGTAKKTTGSKAPPKKAATKKTPQKKATPRKAKTETLPATTKKKNAEEIAKKTLYTPTHNKIMQIKEALLEFLNETGTLPTQEQLSEITGINRGRISQLMKEVDFLTDAFQIKELQLMTPKVLESIYRAATSRIAPNMTAAKLWLQVVHGWKEGVDIKIEERVVKEVIIIGGKEIEF